MAAGRARPLPAQLCTARPPQGAAPGPVSPSVRGPSGGLEGAPLSGPLPWTGPGGEGSRIPGPESRARPGLCGWGGADSASLRRGIPGVGSVAGREAEELSATSESPRRENGAAGPGCRCRGRGVGAAQGKGPWGLLGAVGPAVLSRGSIVCCTVLYVLHAAVKGWRRRWVNAPPWVPDQLAQGAEFAWRCSPCRFYREGLTGTEHTVTVQLQLFSALWEVEEITSVQSLK